LQIQSPST